MYFIWGASIACQSAGTFNDVCASEDTFPVAEGLRIVIGGCTAEGVLSGNPASYALPVITVGEFLSLDCLDDDYMLALIDTSWIWGGWSANERHLCDDMSPV